MKQRRRNQMPTISRKLRTQPPRDWKPHNRVVTAIKIVEGVRVEVDTICDIHGKRGIELEISRGGSMTDSDGTTGIVFDCYAIERIDGWWFEYKVR